ASVRFAEEAGFALESGSFTAVNRSSRDFADETKVRSVVMVSFGGASPRTPAELFCQPGPGSLNVVHVEVFDLCVGEWLANGSHPFLPPAVADGDDLLHIRTNAQ